MSRPLLEEGSHQEAPPFHRDPHILAPLTASLHSQHQRTGQLPLLKNISSRNHDGHSCSMLPEILPTKDCVRRRIFFRFHSFLQLSSIPLGFPGSSVIKDLPASAGDKRDVGLIPGLERSPGGGNGNPPQYSCLENSMDRGAWRVTVHGIAKSWTHSTHSTTHSESLLGHYHSEDGDRGLDASDRFPLSCKRWLSCPMTIYN